MILKMCSSTFATPYGILYFQIQMTPNSAKGHPQIRITNIFCPTHWAYIDFIKEVKVWARTHKTFIKYYLDIFFPTSQNTPVINTHFTVRKLNEMYY